MDEKLMQQVVEAVLRELQAQDPTASACTEGLDKVLVIGSCQSVPQDMAAPCEWLPIEDYIQHRNIHRYQKLLITELTLTQMADIADGRDSSPEACAVISGLLNGLEVYITEAAFPHRRYAGKSSSRLYEVIENHARMLQSFGIKLLRESRVTADPAPARPPKYQAPPVEVPRGTAQVSSSRLITEEAAKALTAGGAKALCLSKEAIVTPLAWDVFRQKGVEITRK